MADPISISGLVFTCGSIVRALVNLYETLKDGPAALKELLSRTTALELLLKRLQAFEQQLNSDRKAFLAAFFDVSKCQETITALAQLVEQTRPSKEGFHQDLKGRLKWLLNKSDAENLVAKLLKQQTDIAMAINMITRLVDHKIRPLYIMYLTTVVSPFKTYSKSLLGINRSKLLKRNPYQS